MIFLQNKKLSPPIYWNAAYTSQHVCGNHGLRSQPSVNQCNHYHMFRSWAQNSRWIRKVI